MKIQNIFLFFISIIFVQDLFSVDSNTRKIRKAAKNSGLGPKKQSIVIDPKSNDMSNSGIRNSKEEESEDVNKQKAIPATSSAMSIDEETNLFNQADELTPRSVEQLSGISLQPAEHVASSAEEADSRSSKIDTFAQRLDVLNSGMHAELEKLRNNNEVLAAITASKEKSRAAQEAYEKEMQANPTSSDDILSNLSDEYQQDLQAHERNLEAFKTVLRERVEHEKRMQQHRDRQQKWEEGVKKFDDSLDEEQRLLDELKQRMQKIADNNQEHKEYLAGSQDRIEKMNVDADKKLQEAMRQYDEERKFKQQQEAREKAQRSVKEVKTSKTEAEDPDLARFGQFTPATQVNHSPLSERYSVGTERHGAISPLDESLLRNSPVKNVVENKTTMENNKNFSVENKPVENKPMWHYSHWVSPIIQTGIEKAARYMRDKFAGNAKLGLVALHDDEHEEGF